MKSIFLILGLITPLIYAGNATHCSKQEEVIFSCSTGKKIVSVCGDHKKISYRFGVIGSPELVFQSANPTGDRLVFMGPSGGEYLRLNNGVYNYVVYTGFGRDWEKAGLVLEKSNQFVKNFQCKSEAISELGSDMYSKYHVKSDDGFGMP